MRVLDLAAGAGGKALALAAAMENQGEIIACDIRGEALAELEQRARAGRRHHHPHRIIWDRCRARRRHSTWCCWMRPAAARAPGGASRNCKWRLTPERLAELTATSGPAAGPGGRATAGGRLVYATCSILPCENQDRVAAFLASQHPGFCAGMDRPDFHGFAPARRPAPTAFIAPLSCAADGHLTHGLGPQK